MRESNLEGRVRVVENKVVSLETKFDMFIDEMRDFKTEMRQQNQMRADEIRELRQDMKTMQSSLDSKIDNMGKHVRNLTVATTVGMGTMTIAGIAIAISIFLGGR